MMEWLVYEGKAALVLAAIWLCWRLLLQRDTIHRLNRAALLGMAVAAQLLPLCVVTVDRTVEVLPMEPVPTEAVSAGVDGVWWQWFLVGLYIVGGVATLARLLLSMRRIRRLVKGSEKKLQADGTVLCINNSVTAPFSWMKWIFLSREDLASPAILTHEKAHVALGHSRDLLLVDLITIVQWFNPVIWLLRQDLRSLHEYEADEKVLESGADAREYQYLLVRKAVEGERFSVANSFSRSTLKGRIAMMCKRPSRRSAAWKMLFVLPLVALTLTLSARTRYTYVGKSQAYPTRDPIFFFEAWSHAYRYVLREDGLIFPLSDSEMQELARSGKIANVEVHTPMIFITTKP